MNIPYAKHEITPEDIQAVTDVLESGMLTNGPALRAFEDDFGNKFGVDHAIGVSSGTAALHLAVAALGVEKDKTVLMPSLTFAATANAVLYGGGNVEFVDIDPKTLVIDVDDVEEKLATDPDRYAGVIGVDFAGYPMDAERLHEVCKTTGKWLLEDAAHSLGAVSRHHDEDVAVGGSEYTDATLFSFHPAKHITSGEGGMVTTRSQQLADKIRLLRNQGMDKNNARAQEEGWFYNIAELGYNYRMSELHAALGRSQLGRADVMLEARQRIAERYREAFDGAEGITIPEYDPAHTNAYHLFIVSLADRLATFEGLKQKGIFTQVHYVPLHMQPLYKPYVEGAQLPNTERYYRDSLSIPMYPTLSEDEQSHVIDSLLNLTSK